MNQPRGGRVGDLKVLEVEHITAASHPTPNLYPWPPRWRTLPVSEYIYFFSIKDTFSNHCQRGCGGLWRGTGLERVCVCVCYLPFPPPPFVCTLHLALFITWPAGSDRKGKAAGRSQCQPRVCCSGIITSGPIHYKLDQSSVAVQVISIDNILCNLLQKSGQGEKQNGYAAV